MDNRSERVSSSVIAKGLVVNGQIDGTGDLKIQGSLQGRIKLDGDCRIEAGGHVDGDVDAKNICLSGKVTGNLQASGRVEIRAAGRIDGNIRVPKIVIIDGASINGDVHVGDA